MCTNYMRVQFTSVYTPTGACDMVLREQSRCVHTRDCVRVQKVRVVSPGLSTRLDVGGVEGFGVTLVRPHECGGRWSFPPDSWGHS